MNNQNSYIEIDRILHCKLFDKGFPDFYLEKYLRIFKLYGSEQILKLNLI